VSDPDVVVGLALSAGGLLVVVTLVAIWVRNRRRG
jgi:hypothetical protein